MQWKQTKSNATRALVSAPYNWMWNMFVGARCPVPGGGAVNVLISMSRPRSPPHGLINFVSPGFTTLFSSLLIFLIIAVIMDRN